jgi:hypothetical protein
MSLSEPTPSYQFELDVMNMTRDSFPMDDLDDLVEPYFDENFMAQSSLEHYGVDTDKQFDDEHEVHLSLNKESI